MEQQTEQSALHQATLAVVFGAAGCGKSSYAESLCMAQAGKGSVPPVYLATMPSSGDDAARRIERHRQLRAGKGFVTRELPHICADTTPAMLKQAQGAAVLLECAGTLAANELFDEESRGAAQGRLDDWRLRALLGEAAWGKFERACAALPARQGTALRRAVDGAAQWLSVATLLVVVTNDVFADEGRYDPETLGYRDVLGAFNRVLAARAERVVEVVCGIPLTVKGEGA